MTVITITQGEVAGLLSDPAHPFEVKDLDGNAYSGHNGNLRIRDDKGLEAAGQLSVTFSGHNGRRISR